MSQNFTDDCFLGSHVGQTDLQNMENNFACLKSNFSGASAPSNPVAGMWWFDTDDSILKIYSGSAWVSVYNYSTGQYYISAGMISAAMIASSAVTEAKIASAAVTTAKISTAARVPSLVAAQDIAPNTISKAMSAGVSYFGALSASGVSLNNGWTIVTTATIKNASGEFTFSYSGEITGAVLGTTLYFEIRKNGTLVGSRVDHSGVATFSGSQDISGWSSGDTVGLYQYINTSGRTIAVDVNVGVADIGLPHLQHQIDIP